MDPANFILRKENRQSMLQRERQKKAKKKYKGNPLKKTVMRPHYICLSEEDTRQFLKQESKTPLAAHPVRGHWRTLQSERFVNKQGERIYIKQYFTGDGKIEAEGGWQYQVMVKESPNRISLYGKESA